MDAHPTAPGTNVVCTCEIAKLAAEQHDEVHDDRVGHRVADTGGAPADGHALVGGHDRADHPEDRGLDEREPQVGGSRQRGHGRQVAAGGEVLGHHADDQRRDDREEHHHAVEQHRHGHRRQGTREHEPLDDGDAHDLERVELLADLARAEVRADRGACHAGEHQRRDHGRGLADDGQGVAGSGEADGTDLLGEDADLERQHDPERDRDRERGQGADADGVPGLADVLLDGEARSRTRRAPVRGRAARAVGRGRRPRSSVGSCRARRGHCGSGEAREAPAPGVTRTSGAGRCAGPSLKCPAR